MDLEGHDLKWCPMIDPQPSEMGQAVRDLQMLVAQFTPPDSKRILQK